MSLILTAGIQTVTQEMGDCLEAPHSAPRNDIMPLYLPTRIESAALLTGRLLLATVFIHEGVAKLGNYAGSAAFAKAFGVPEALLPFAIATELSCGLLIAIGVCVRPSAYLLAGFCLTTALIFHTKFSEINQLLHFEKNLAIAGGLLVLAVCGPGALSVGKPFQR